ncbi:DJ-1/PfpI family protein [Chitinophaga filiformis]|uniref:DJ-1/PfpI family protein n=1 Tax=Chitinophaga filiformis TaxID=104663 RepID=UPI001F42C761|nr:DJ-1/PfpI family protein [Chitinophaga filiformis]MCF6406543.1 DJ-1/PfpI family protein [Chitinophaga filiformis]
MSQQKILFITGDYAEDYETMVPFQMMQMIGHTIHAVCPDKSAGDKIITAIHDFEGDQTYSEKRGHYFVLNASFADVQVSSYDALMIAGGRAPEYLRLNTKVIDIVKQFVAANKPIAAICHGIQILTAADVVRGRTLTAYPAVAPEVTLAGGTYASVNIDEAVTDGNLVTAPAWPAHPQWVAAFLKVLGTQIQL